MKLKKPEVDAIARDAVDRLLAAKILTIKTTREAVQQAIGEAILTDLRAEDALDEEVRNLLDAHRGAMKQGDVDPGKMFRLAKKQLIKDRKLDEKGWEA